MDQLGLLVQQLLELLHLGQADILGLVGLQEDGGWFLGGCCEWALQLRQIFVPEFGPKYLWKLLVAHVHHHLRGALR